MKTLIRNIKELVQVERTPRTMVKGADMAKIDTIKNAYLIVEDGKISSFGEMRDLPEGSFDKEYDAT